MNGRGVGPAPEAQQPQVAEQVIARRRTIRAFDETRTVPLGALAAAVAAAATAPAPHHTRPWRFVRLRPETRHLLLDAMAQQWRDDLLGAGTPEAVVERRLARSDEVLRRAPELLVPLVALDQSHAYPDDRRSRAERDLFILSGGAALQNLQVVLASHGVGAAWISSTSFCPETVRDVLDLPATWDPIGMVAVGYPSPSHDLRPRPPVDPASFLLER